MTWKRFPYYWPFVRGICCLPVDSPHKASAIRIAFLCHAATWQKWNFIWWQKCYYIQYTMSSCTIDAYTSTTSRQCWQRPPRDTRSAYLYMSNESGLWPWEERRETQMIDGNFIESRNECVPSSELGFDKSKFANKPTVYSNNTANGGFLENYLFVYSFDSWCN